MASIQTPWPGCGTMLDRVEDALHAIERVALQAAPEMPPHDVVAKSCGCALDEVPRHRHVGIDGAGHHEARGANEPRRRQAIRAPAVTGNVGQEQQRARGRQRGARSARAQSERAARCVAPPDRQSFTRPYRQCTAHRSLERVTRRELERARVVRLRVDACRSWRCPAPCSQAPRTTGCRTG